MNLILLVAIAGVQYINSYSQTDNQTDWKPANFSNYSSWCNSNNTQVCDEVLEDLKDAVKEAFTD